MDTIAIQPYYKVEREVNSIEQYNVEEERNILLYDDRITTKHHVFTLPEVLDISYRTFGREGGLLYIHTTGGLFSYTVKKSPQKFIEAYEVHKGTRAE
ncbi:hypothetical protein VBD025_04725 [Virgibacillus flavescens]|uniref:hypothetical protein n=1 Tax=Virgibacillus flavescens TaxID=1611422 RepID=UPI003D32EDA4